MKGLHFFKFKLCKNNIFKPKYWLSKIVYAPFISITQVLLGIVLPIMIIKKKNKLVNRVVFLLYMKSLIIY